MNAELQKLLRDLEEMLRNVRERFEHEEAWNKALDAQIVIQVELSRVDKAYEVHLRFENDVTELLGVFSDYSSAFDYTREQAYRYKIPIFDSSYEVLVD